jgi:hypothetical protein
MNFKFKILSSLYEVEQPFYIECNCPKCGSLCKTNEDTRCRNCEFNVDNGFAQTMFCWIEDCQNEFDIKFRVNFSIESNDHQINFEQKYDV